MFESIEGEAGLMLKRSGDGDSEAPRVLDLARRVLGDSGALVTVHARALPGDACLVVVRGQRRIYLRRGLDPARQRWAVAHELGHVALGLDSSSRANEDACDAFAAALLLPRRAFQSALRQTGLSYTKLARWFVTTESCAALRLGEVTDVPLALVAPSRTRVRGAEFGWPAELTSGRIQGVRRATLRDDRRRVALRAG
jgi:hypothetical protein